MKKSLAVLLSAAMVLSLVACSKEETTKKKKKKKATKKTTTEESTPESTDEPTESTTEEPTVPTDFVPLNASDFMHEGVLTYIDPCMPFTQFSRGYVSDETEEYLVRGALRTLSVGDDPAYTALQQSIDNVLDQYSDAVTDLYIEANKSLYANNSDEGLEYLDYSVNYEISRVDSEVYSFAVTEATGFDLTVLPTYNFRSQDGSVITQDDICPSREALAEYIEDYFSYYGSQDWVASMATLARSGELPFTMTYDGIYLWEPYGAHFQVNKLPVIPNQEIFNLDYFGSLPQYYALRSTFDGECENLDWDFDGDGEWENLTVRLSEENDDIWSSPLLISLDGTSYSTADAGVDFSSWGVEYFYVMKTDSGYYLYVVAGAPEGFHDIYVFSLNGEISFIDFYQDAWFTCETFTNPEYIGVIICDWLIQLTRLYNSFTVVGYGGKFVYIYTSFVSDDDPHRTMVDFHATLLDENLNVVQEDYVVPAGTALITAYYYPEDDMLILQIVHPYGEPKEYVYLTIERTDEGNRLDGKTMFELFDIPDGEF